MASALLVFAFPSLSIAEDAGDDAVFNSSAPDGTVFYGPVPFTFGGATTYEVGIVAQNAYDAAAYVLGYDPNSEQFTPEVKALLSNAETGTTFYGFAQNFSHPNPAGGIWNPEFWTTASTLYGAWRTWRGEYTQTGMIAARVALEAILNGGGSGGGSGGGTGGAVESDGFVLIDMTPTGYLSDTMSIYAGVAFHKSYYDNIMNTINASSDGIQLWVSLGGTRKYVTVNVCSLQPRFESDYSYFWPQGGITFNRIFPSGGFWQGYVSDEIEYENKRYLVVPCNPSSNSGVYTTAVGQPVRDANMPVYSYYYGSGGIIVSPDNNWPVPVDPHIWDEPPVPDPPDPSSPVITDDPIYLPDPTMPIPTPEDGPTYTTADLSAVLDAMNRHCIHLQNAIYGAASRFWGMLSSKMTNDLSAFTAWLGDWLEVIADNITDGILNLEGYLHDLAVWLTEQFDYTFTSSAYDDGSIVAWLKKIWAKLGTGPIVTRPDDPVADPIGIGDWLGSFFAGLLNDLKGLIDSILGEFGTDLETLITKFPISIPWDVAIVLGALVAPPQVPHIEYPMYTVGMGGLEYVTDVVIDLSDWSDIMAVVRNFELLTFGGFLAMKTKHFMELMEGVDV